MNVQPYPVGTRVVTTWSMTPHFIGMTGTAFGAVVEAGTPLLRADNLRPMTTQDRSQMVEWDQGFRAFAPIAWLRPIQDPDAEPIETEQEVTA